MKGWVKVYRELLDKPIWTESTPVQKTILITLLLMANNVTNEWEWEGKPYKADPGQFVTSIKGIMEKAGKGVTSQNVRTALLRFERYDFLTSKSTNKNRLVTIVNWGKYQSSQPTTSKQTNKQLTSNQQATNKQLTTIKELKELKNKDNVVQRSSDQLNGQVLEVITYLNSQTGKHFMAKSKDNTKLIKARINDGYSVADFKQVIDNKAYSWLHDKDMSVYLRPSTLFRSGKFDEYLNERITKTPVDSGKAEAAEMQRKWQAMTQRGVNIE